MSSTACPVASTTPSKSCQHASATLSASGASSVSPEETGDTGTGDASAGPGVPSDAGSRAPGGTGLPSFSDPTSLGRVTIGDPSMTSRAWVPVHARRGPGASGVGTDRKFGRSVSGVGLPSGPCAGLGHSLPSGGMASVRSDEEVGPSRAGPPRASTVTSAEALGPGAISEGAGPSGAGGGDSDPGAGLEGDDGEPSSSSTTVVSISVASVSCTTSSSTRLTVWCNTRMQSL
mmetsp:Transcript_108209/g.186828  ORF Transcript_108209/g.186828 Transcript_108209/m.186828 type:complete len:232 (+) Transcript_108209:2189-2884(+)